MRPNLALVKRFLHPFPAKKQSSAALRAQMRVRQVRPRSKLTAA